MSNNHEDDEFVAVRVQDPRIQNEGSWNSYVDYKIFLHTNSKAFTAKTSCVRRRYSEFEWLRKKLQKNAGLVPVPDLPGKSFFSFDNEDFLEKRRRGLQVFLDKVVHTTVCLSDSQLHLFLQTQLPVGHIQDCVQGHTPYSVTDAILTYASSNRGLAQAQQEDSIREPSLTVSYESMESPTPHQPFLQLNSTLHSKPVPGGDTDPLEDILELCEPKPDETQHGNNSSVRISQTNDQLEAIVEERGSAKASFYLGKDMDDSQSLSPGEPSCVIQTPVEVHSAMETSYEDSCEGDSVFGGQSDTGDFKERNCCQSEICVDSEEVLALEDDEDEDIVERDAALKDSSQISEGRHADVKPENDKQDNETDSGERTQLQSGVEESLKLNGEFEVDLTDSRQQEESENSDRFESNEDSNSLLSSNESIIKCSEEESLGEDTEDSMQVKSWSEVEGGRSDVLHINGFKDDKEDAEDWKDPATNGASPDPKPAAARGDPSENCDFSILETNCQSGVDDREFTAPALMPLAGSEA